MIIQKLILLVLFFLIYNSSLIADSFLSPFHQQTIDWQIKNKNKFSFLLKNKKYTINNNAWDLLLTTTHIDCNNALGSITAQTVAVGITYQLNGGIPQSHNIFSDLSAGIYTITAKDIYNEIHIETIEILDNREVDNNWDFSLNAIGIFCANDLGKITVISSRSDVEYSLNGYVWQSSNEFNFLTEGNYTVIARTLNGCNLKEHTITIENFGALNYIVTTNDIYCPNNLGSLIVDIEEANFTFSLNGGNPQISNTFNNLSAGDYTLTVQNEFCSQEKIFTIRDLSNSNPITIFPIPVLCNNQNARLGMIENFQSYIWSTGETTPSIQTCDNINNYSVTVTDTNNCVYTHTYIITRVNTNIIPEFNISDIVCTTSLPLLQLTHNFVTYSWSTGATTSSVQMLPDLNYYQVTVTDANACVFTKEINLTIVSPWDFSIVTKEIKCAGQLSEIQINSNKTGLKYALDGGVWQTNNSFENLQPNTYSISAKDENGCINQKVITITTPESLVLNVEGINNSCIGFLDAKILVSANGGTPISCNNYYYSLDKHNWYIRDAFQNLQSGIYTVYAKDANNCIDSVNVTLEEAAPFFITSAPENVTITYGSSVNLLVTVNDNSNVTNQYWYSTYNHNRVHTLLNIDTDRISITPMTTTNYKYVIKNNLGCRLDTTIVVKVLTPRDVNAPNAFTPNGDGNNDNFYIQGNENTITKIINFRVYDRWGNIVFENQNIPINNIHYGWDGTFKGQPIQSGVFAWSATVEFIDNYVEVFKGNVTLIR